MPKKTIDKVKLTVLKGSSYELLVKATANDVFNPHFTEQIVKMLSRKYNKTKSANILRCLVRGVSIPNKATFYSRFKYGVGDIGHEAWRTSEDDILKFVPKVIGLMQFHQMRGEDEIDLSSVLFYLAFFKGYKQAKSETDAKKWKNLMAARSIAAATIGSKTNPFVIRVAHPKLVSDIGDKLGLPNSYFYRSVVGAFLNVYNEFYDKQLCREKNTTITFPRLEYIIPVTQEIRQSQIAHLAFLLKEKITVTKRFVEDIPVLSEESPELNAVIERMKQKAKMTNIDTKYIIKTLKKLEDDGTLLTYPDLKDHHRYFADGIDFALNIATYGKFKVKDAFVEKESFLQNVFNEASRITVDCSKCEYFHQIEPLVQGAAELMMTKDVATAANGMSSYSGIEDPILHIELKNVKFYDVYSIAKIKDIEKKICSQFLKKFLITIQYDEETATSRLAMCAPTHIRVISDIHADVNKDKNYIFDFGNDLVVNCGDTAGDCETTKAWVKAFMKRGVLVPGNHLGYSPAVPELDGVENIEEYKAPIHFFNTRDGQISNLMHYLNSHEYVSLLSNHMIEREGIIFMGNTLYTDFKLFGEENQASCMMEAARGMNDFKLIHTIQKEGVGKKKIVTFSPENYVRLFKVCRGYLDNRLKALRKKHNRKPIVVVTHHMPLPYCVADKYKNSPLSAAFASDMRDFIKEYPEIRLWCSGHTHDPYDFIYNETRFVCEPWGYYNENGFDSMHYGNRIPISDLITKRTWRSVLKKEIDMGIVKDYGYCE